MIQLPIESIDQFKGEYAWLSNFYPCNIQLGLGYATVEHYYVAMKTLDVGERCRIATLPADSAGRVKRLGRKLKLRPDWESVKLKVMLEALREKFSDKTPELKAKLLATGNMYISEGNNWGDKFWGVCLKTNSGKNYLGRLIMQVRKELQEKENANNP